MIFTGGGTESDNLALKGIFWARHDEQEQRRRILVGAAEHHAVLDTVEWLESHCGAEITWLDVDSQGRVSPDDAPRRHRRGSRDRGAGRR